jgi:hypothetical protein
VFQLTRRSLRLHLLASLKTPVDLLAQARIVAVDVVDAAIAQPAQTASRHAAATARRGTRARPSTLFMLTSSIMEDLMASPACHQFRRDSTAETHRRGDPTPVSSPIQEAEKERTEKIPTQAAARRLGYADQNPPHYEDDHLISLELGGAPYSKKNLWPRPWSQAHKKDPRENAWHKKLFKGTLTLEQAQKLELAYMRKYG